MVVRVYGIVGGSRPNSLGTLGSQKDSSLCSSIIAKQVTLRWDPGTLISTGTVFEQQRDVRYSVSQTLVQQAAGLPLDRAGDSTVVAGLMVALLSFE